MMRWKITDCARMQKYFMLHKISIVQKLSINQSAKVICRFDRLRTAYSKRQTNYMSIGNLSATHTFDYNIHSAQG